MRQSKGTIKEKFLNALINKFTANLLDLTYLYFLQLDKTLNLESKLINIVYFAVLLYLKFFLYGRVNGVKHSKNVVKHS